MIAGFLTATALLVQTAPQPGCAQSDAATAAPWSAPTPTDLERISTRLDAIDAVVNRLLRRVEAIEERLDVPVSVGVNEAVEEGPAAPEFGPATPPQPAGTDALPTMRAPGPVVQPEDAEPAPSAGSAAPPSSRPGELEVDEEAIDRALERTLVEAGALLLPFGQAELQPTFRYTRRENDVPVRFVENGTAFVGERRVRRNEFETSLALRVGLPFDAQAEFRVPYRYVDQSTVRTVGPVARDDTDDSGSSLGDISIGIAKTLLREQAWRPDVVARLLWDTATGEQTDNDVVFAGGFHELVGSLSLVKRVDPLAFTSSFGYEASFEEDDIDPGDTFLTSLGGVLAVTPTTSLRFVFDADFSDDTQVDGVKVPGSDGVLATFTIGGSTVLGRGVFFDLAGTIGVTDRSPDFAIRAALPIRFSLPFLGSR